MAKSRRLPPIHPGEILREDFMVPLGISMNKLALDLRVPVTRVAEIVHERRGITPDTALRLGRYFNTSARFWLNAQAAYDLEVAQDELRSAVEREVRAPSWRCAKFKGRGEGVMSRASRRAYAGEFAGPTPASPIISSVVPCFLDAIRSRPPAPALDATRNRVAKGSGLTYYYSKTSQEGSPWWW